jgi:phage terminase Nu1 subunit (DNA packaging protein)
MTTSTPTARYLNSMATASHFGVSTSTLQQWTRYAHFPADCRKREGQDVLWDIKALTAWLCARPVSTRGARPRWLGKVSHPAA